MKRRDKIRIKKNHNTIMCSSTIAATNHRLQEISARRPQFLPLSFLHPAIQVGQMIAQEAD